MNYFTLKRFTQTALALLLGIMLFSSIFIEPCLASDITTSKDVENLKKEIIPIKTVKAGSGLEDLAQLKNSLSNKTIIAMGEPTHSNKEFFEAKHRMFEFLVKELGYKTFAIEGDFGGAQIVNDYILNGNGTAKDTVKSMGFWVWDVDEVVSMVEWMRAYNKTVQANDKIKFYGFDMQMYDTNKDLLISYLKKVDLKTSQACTQTLSILNTDNIETTNENELNKVSLCLKDLTNILSQNKQIYISKSSSEEYDFACKYIDILNQNISRFTNKNTYGNPLRDNYMASNVNWILEHEQKFGNNKMFIWAHNGHVDKNSTAGYYSMGNFLKDKYQNQYYAIGTEFYDSNFRAFNELSDKRELFTLSTYDSNSLAYKFHETNIPIGYLDFSTACNNASIKELLYTKQPFHSIGSTFNDMYYLSSNCYTLNQVPIESYDGLFFVDSASPATPLS